MTDNSDARVVIVGAGHGGGNMVASLRIAGHKGPVLLFGDEPVVPYHRPPLSKAYLKGQATMESLKLRPDNWYENHGVELHLGRTVTSLDRAARTITTEEGIVHPYDILVLATGSRARRLPVPGADFTNVYHLRNIADADAIRDSIGPGRRLVVVGGGYVGLEAAASARALGAEVTLLERESRILARVACEPLAAFFDKEHRGNGVEILTEVKVEEFTAADTGDDKAGGVRLADGRVIPCDAILVGVGALICDDLARQAGLECTDGGVQVDENARTSDPSIYAIGDMTWRPMPLYGGRMFRLESVPNAAEQAKRAAHDIMGAPQPAHEVPWFWSDQYHLKLQIAGVPFDSHRLVIRGSVHDGKFAIYHLAADNRVLAVEAVNMPAEFMGGRVLVGDSRRVDPERLGDMSVAIKEIVKGG